MHKYMLNFRIAFEQQVRNPGGWFARLALFGVLLLVFSRLWESAFRGAVGDAVSLTWYMAITELVVVALPMLHLEIEHDVRSGDIAYKMTRPCSYVGMQIARGFGLATANFLLIGTVGFLLVYGLVGVPEVFWSRLPMALIMAAGGLAMATMSLVAIGLSSFWTQDAAPLYWVWQKMVFVIGGLILPLTFYPEWLQSIAAWTPFTAMLYRPAYAMVDGSGGMTDLAIQGVWVCLILVTTMMIYRRASRIVDINGG